MKSQDFFSCLFLIMLDCSNLLDLKLKAYFFCPIVQGVGTPCRKRHEEFSQIKMFNLNYVLELLAYFSFNLFFILKVVAVSGVDLDSIQEKLKIEAH